jgi:hypothetical protein
VHRSRLFAQHLPAFEWEPVILTVDEMYYEEELDPNLLKLLPSNLRIEKVKAWKVTKPRLVGDIGLRAFFQLYGKAKHIIKNERIDFLYITIPSFYIALLGRWLNATTGIKYGIDYIDPWVHDFPGSHKFFSRHWWSKMLSGALEPIAVKNVSLITGVAEGYYADVLKRNPLLKKKHYGAMPFGGEQQDHEILKKLQIEPYLFKKDSNKIKLVYAGAMLPKSFKPLEKILESIAANPSIFGQTEFHFIGTGKTPDDVNGFNIKILAEKYGLWNKVIFEYPKRIPYLDVLIHLSFANGIFILGSTEPHYTPSKVYQGILSGKPILGVMHKLSTAATVIDESGSGVVLRFEESNLEMIRSKFASIFSEFLSKAKNYGEKSIDKAAFENYSAKNVTKKLADLLDKASEEKHC